MTDRQLFKETFSGLHASEDTIREVMDMVQRENKHTHERRPARTGLLIALAAALLMGTAFAAVRYRLHSEPVGELAAAVSVAADGGTGAVAFSSGEASGVTFTGVELTAGWLPEGMALNPGETMKWSFADTPYQGGFSAAAMPLDTGNAAFCEVVPDAVTQESVAIAGHEGVLVTTDGGGFDKRLFISYPEYNTVLDMFVGSDVTREEALKFAENLTVAAGDYEMSRENLRYNGERYKDAANTVASGAWVHEADAQTASEPDYLDPAGRAAAEGMAHAHAIGESFTVPALDAHAGGGLRILDLPVKVTEAVISDDISALRDTAYLDASVAALLDESGRLPEDTLRFYRHGDGISTPSVTAAASETQQPKLAAVTFEVTNDTDETIEDMVYGARLMAVEETENGFAAYRPVPENGADYDDYGGESMESLSVMRYYDVTDADGKNHITELVPGESVTVQVAFVVNECEAEHLWFFFDSGDLSDVTDGYVDLRGAWNG